MELLVYRYHGYRKKRKTTGTTENSARPQNPSCHIQTPPNNNPTYTYDLQIQPLNFYKPRECSAHISCHGPKTLDPQFLPLITQR